MEIDRERLAEIAHKLGLDLIVLFGSHAKDRARPGSDLDVAVRAIRRPWGDWNWEFEVANALSGAIRLSGSEIDVSLLNDASPLLMFEVARSGQLLYEKELGVFSEWKSYAARVYYDNEPRFKRQAGYLRDSTIGARTAYLVQQKLDHQEAYVAELDPFVRLDYADYQRQPGYNRITERLVQIIVESAVDINEKLIEAMSETPPGTARESFEAVQRLGVIDDDLSAVFCRTYVGLRNRIVHAYEKLDDHVVYFNARRLLDDAKRYIAAVHLFMDQNKPGESQ